MDNLTFARVVTTSMHGHGAVAQSVVLNNCRRAYSSAWSSAAGAAPGPAMSKRSYSVTRGMRALSFPPYPGFNANQSLFSRSMRARHSGSDAATTKLGRESGLRPTVPAGARAWCVSVSVKVVDRGGSGVRGSGGWLWWRQWRRWWWWCQAMLKSWRALSSFAVRRQEGCVAAHAPSSLRYTVPCTEILRVAVKHFGLSEAHVAVGW
jgi:hypothetical protein